MRVIVKKKDCDGATRYVLIEFIQSNTTWWRFAGESTVYNTGEILRPDVAMLSKWAERHDWELIDIV